MMARKQPKDSNFFRDYLDLPKEERKVIAAYVYARTYVKGAKPGEMTPAELMQWLTTIPGEEAA